VSGCACLQVCRHVCVCIVLISQPYLYGMALTLSCSAYSTVTIKSYSLTDNDYSPYFLAAHSAYPSKLLFPSWNCTNAHLVNVQQESYLVILLLTRNTREGHATGPIVHSPILRTILEACNNLHYPMTSIFRSKNFVIRIVLWQSPTPLKVNIAP